MTDQAEDVFVTVFPRDETSEPDVRLMIEDEGLKVSEQVQFAGKAAFETAVKFSKEAIEQLAKLARKLLDADKIDEITVEYGKKKVTLRGIPADRQKSVVELTDMIFSKLRE